MRNVSTTQAGKGRKENPSRSERLEEKAAAIVKQPNYGGLALLCSDRHEPRGGVGERGARPPQHLDLRARLGGCGRGAGVSAMQGQEFTVASFVQVTSAGPHGYRGCALEMSLQAPPEEH